MATYRFRLNSETSLSGCLELLFFWRAIVRSMESSDRSTLPCSSQHRASIASMGKGKATPASSIPAIRARSNQDDDDSSKLITCSTADSQTMQRSTSAFDPHHEAATSSILRSKSVLVLRRCEDLNIRTGGFQKIEEDAHRLDIRRARQLQQSPAARSKYM
ncbi:hypothetical protein DVH05_016046 [Phytophthora capsici]|nr:hypothetical protein DVH05_016046 [Phytophthora capsici]